MDETKSAKPRSVTGPFGPSAERRQLTVVYCDLVDSTTLFATLDPEEVGEILRSYCQLCADRIEAAGGFVAQFQGDGVIGYFGYPRATESDAERAVRVALALVSAVPQLPTVKGRSIATRVGISTGLAIIGAHLHQGTRLEQGAIGEALHLAARLQAIGSANDIVIADSTKRLTGRLFTCQSMGSVELKGFPEPVAAWKVLGARPIINRTGMRFEPLLTQIVNREAELELLLQTWEKVVATGEGQIVSITGAAGIGKSRLIAEFRHKIAGREHIWIEGSGSQFFANTPFHAAAQVIRRTLDPGGRSSPVEFQARLEHSLSEAGIEPGEALSLIVEMLGEPGSTLAAAPGERRTRLITTLVDWLLASARQRALVVVVEDLQWLDPSSLEVVDHVAGRIKTSPVLMLQSTRSGAHAALPATGSSSHLAVQRLDDDELRQLVSRTDAAASLSEGDVARVLQRAEGVPLFGIELTRLMGAQQSSNDNRDIPATLADLLAARLDQLGQARVVAQVAAVIGDAVSLPLLQAVSELPARRLRALVATLISHDVLQKAGKYGDPVYRFTHALLRDAAYNSLLRAERRKLHHKVATALTGQLAEMAAPRPELVAHHWTQAGEFDRAFGAWQRAGDFAGGRMAFREAEQAYQNALSALMALPETAERDTNELALASALADVLRITRGFSAQETKDATRRASALADRFGDREQQFIQLWGTWTAASSGGDHASAIKVANQFHQLALADGSPNHLAHACMIRMTSRYRLGDLLGAEGDFERGEQFFRFEEFERRPGVIAQTYGNAARIAWLLGNDVAANSRIDHALMVAEKNDSPFDRAYAEYMAGIHGVLVNKHDLAADFARDAIALSDKYNIPQFAAISRVVLGRALAGLGSIDDGALLIREGLARMAASSVRVAVTLYWTWLAEVHVLSGSFDDALVAVDEALSINPQELFFRPETVRVRGQILTHLGRTVEAEHVFLDAIALASQIGARRFSERAVRSLRLLLQERSAVA